MKKATNYELRSSKNWMRFFSLFSFLFILTACYSFSGSSLTEDYKTIKINEFINTAAFVNPNLAQQFNIDIQNRFLQRTTLKGTTENPSILIEGEITDYLITPTTISNPTEGATGTVIQAAQNKLTITVKVRFEDSIDPTRSFERTYSDEAVFPSDMEQSQIETSQVKLVNERIINKIFNDIAAAW